MSASRLGPVAQALGAAVLFGASAPIITEKLPAPEPMAARTESFPAKARIEV